MSKHADHRAGGFIIVTLVVSLLLSGCIKDLFGGENPSPGKPQFALLSTGISGGPSRQSPPPALPGQAVEMTGLLPPRPSLGTDGPSPGTAAGSSRLLASAATAGLSYGDAVLTEDCTWRGEVSIAGVVTVAPQATLTIEPGAVIRFGVKGENTGRNSLLLVYGRIVAGGTREKPIRFTSRFAKPMAGDWRGIVLLGSEKKNLLASCRIEGAETGLDASYAMVTLKNVQFSRCTTGARYRDCIVQATGGGASGCILGVRLMDSEADLRSPDMAGNRQGVAAERSSLYLVGGSFIHNDLESLKAVDCRVKITGGAYSANGAGIDLELSQGSVYGVKLAENADYGIRLASSRVKVYGSEIIHNSGSGMQVSDGRGAAWGNALYANGTYDLVNSGSEEFIALGNWWGTPEPAAAGRRIYPAHSDNGPGRVLYLPLLKANPLNHP